jgi:hypothetical protein
MKKKGQDKHPFLSGFDQSSGCSQMVDSQMQAVGRHFRIKVKIAN